MGIIYIATSPSGKSYIGQTISTLEKRMVNHKAYSKRYDFVFYRAKQNMSISRKGMKFSKLHKDNIRNAAINLNKPGKPVCQFALNGNFIQDFFTISAAARFLRKNTDYKKAASSEIRVACRNFKHVRYGYRWKLKED